MSDSKSKVALLHFRQYYDELLTFLTRRLGSHEQALDAIQETFLRVLSQKSSHPIDNPRAFLYKTARNLTIDMFRREQKHTHVSLESDDIQSALTVEPDQEQRVEGKERLHRLYLAIQELPPKCRHVFLLHKFQERSQMEIAIQLGISKNMVEKHVMKALAHCKRRLDDSSLVSASSRSTRTSLRRYESSIPRERSNNGSKGDG
ncbi:RNA polymerase sigma factor [Candidatus Nitrospira salsa]